MTQPRVVRVGPLMPFLEEALVREYDAPSLADVGDRTAGLEVAVAGGGTLVGAAEMDALPDLRAVANFGVGDDNVDVAEATRAGSSSPTPPTCSPTRWPTCRSRW